MAKDTLVKQIDELTELHKCPRTGLAWVTNGRTGDTHSAHPNIDHTGSVTGMVSRGYWKKDDRVIRTNGAFHNVSRRFVEDELDELADQHCTCGYPHIRKD